MDEEVMPLRKAFSCEMENKEEVGIIADSHGNCRKMAKALECLVARGCKHVFHLGDICDSSHPETADKCASILMRNDVTALKGNNDHALVAGHGKSADSEISHFTLAWLENLRLQAEFQEAVFAHSLPLEKELGLSCMVRGLGDDEAGMILNRFPGKIVFRGHGHASEIKWMPNGKVKTMSLAPGHDIDISRFVPCIVTCGALYRGLYMVWNPGTKRLFCRDINGQKKEID